MKYTNIICEGCNSAFTEEDDVVVCPECGTPQHRECWNKEHVCVNTSKHSDTFAWIMPDWKVEENKPKMAEPVKLKTDADRLAQEIKFDNGESVSVCPHCNALNYEEDVYCRRCSRRLKEGDGAAEIRPDATEMLNEKERNQEEVYYSFRQYGGLSKDSEIDGIPVSEYSQYAGGKAPGKIIRRIKNMERSGKNFSINPVVIFLGPIWYFYKKMAGIGIAFILALALCGTVSTVSLLSEEAIQIYRNEFAVVQGITEGRYSQSVGMEMIEDLQTKLNELEYSNGRMMLYYAMRIASGAVYVAMVVKADSFYRKKAKKDIMRARAENDNMNDYLLDIGYRGGSSGALAILGIICSAAGYFIQIAAMYAVVLFI